MFGATRKLRTFLPIISVGLVTLTGCTKRNALEVSYRSDGNDGSRASAVGTKPPIGLAIHLGRFSTRTIEGRGSIVLTTANSPR
jgi:hypothetical protein